MKRLLAREVVRLLLSPGVIMYLSIVVGKSVV